MAETSAKERLIALLGRDVDLVSIIDDFGHLIYGELDYGIEARNAARFARFYGGIANVSSPAVFPELSTARLGEWRSLGAPVAAHAACSGSRI